MAGIGALIINLGANLAGLRQDMAQAEQIAAKAGKAIAGGLAAGAVGLAVITKAAIDAADKLQDVSNRIGVSVTSLSELKFAAEQSGASFDTLNRGLQNIGKNAAAAASGNKGIAAAFDAVGVSVKGASGDLKGADELFADLADRFATFKEGPEKSALALKLFGKAGSELIPVLNEGKAGLSAFADEAKRLNVSVSDELAKNAAEFNDQLGGIGQATEGLGNAIAEILLPNLIDLAKGFKEIVVGAKDIALAFPGVTAGVIAEFDKIRIGGIEKVELLVNGALIAWNSIEAGASALGAKIKIIFAGAADAAIGGFAEIPGAIGRFASTLGIDSTELEEAAAALKRSASLQAEVTAAANETAAAYARNRQALIDQSEAISTNAEQQKALADATALSFDRTQAAAGAIKNSGDAAGQTAPLVAALAKGSKDLGAAQKDATDFANGLAEALAKQLTAEQEVLRVQLDAINLRKEQNARIGDALESQNRELALLKLTGAARDQLAQQYRVEDIALAALGKRKSELTDKEREAYAVAVANLGIGEKLITQAQIQAQAIEEQARFYDQLGGSISSAFGDFATEALTNFDSIGEAFDNLGDSLGNIAKRAIADIISEFARLKLINPLLNSILGTNLQTGGSSILGSLLGGGAGAGGGGLGAAIGGLFGGGGGLMSGLASLFGGGGGSAISAGASAWNAGATGSGIGLGTVLGAAGGAFSTYSAYRSGDPLGGALGGAISGAQVGGPVGAVIGAIVGGVAGLLGGPKPPDLRLGGVGVTRKPEVTFSTALGQQQVGVRGGVDEREFIKLVTDFDATIAGIVGSFKGGNAQLESVRVALSRFAIDLKGDAISAEAVLGGRFNAILSTFSADIQAFVGTTGETAARVQRLADASIIDQSVGAGLFDTFAEAAAILTSYRVDTESLADTYLRIAGSVDLLDDVLEGLGLTASGTRAEFIEFAAGLTAAFGSLDNAAAIIGRNIQGFLSPDEQLAIQRRTAANNLTAAGGAAGIEGVLSNDDFRALLNQALAGAFTPERTAAILRYGAALLTFNEVMATGPTAIAAGANDANVSIEDTAALQASARASIRQILSGLSDEIADFGRTDYQRAVAAFTANFKQTEAALIELAEAAGRSGQPIEGLSEAIELLELQTADALAGLRRTVLRSLIDLYPSEPITFTSELDLFTRGMRNAAQGTANWAEQLERLERLDAATNLARNLKDLFAGGDISASLKEFGVPIERLLKDLGVNFSDLFNPRSLEAFGRAARLLGISADELAALAGIDLSGLDPTQRSALNTMPVPAEPKVVDTKDPETTTAVDNLAKDARDGLANVKASVDELRGDFRKLTDELTRIRTSPAGLPA